MNTASKSVKTRVVSLLYIPCPTVHTVTRFTSQTRLRTLRFFSDTKHRTPSLRINTRCRQSLWCRPSVCALSIQNLEHISFWPARRKVSASRAFFAQTNKATRKQNWTCARKGKCVTRVLGLTLQRHLEGRLDVDHLVGVVGVEMLHGVLRPHHGHDLRRGQRQRRLLVLTQPLRV